MFRSRLEQLDNAARILEIDENENDAAEVVQQVRRLTDRKPDPNQLPPDWLGYVFAGLLGVLIAAGILVLLLPKGGY